MTANSQVVRALVADGRADLGVAASRPDHTPNPGIRETELIDDAIVCAVPPAHRWAGRRTCAAASSSSPRRWCVRDPSSNARWTVDAVLAPSDLRLADPLVEAATPRAALAEARRRNAPVLLSRHVSPAPTSYPSRSRASSSRAATCWSRPPTASRPARCAS